LHIFYVQSLWFIKPEAIGLRAAANTMPRWKGHGKYPATNETMMDASRVMFCSLSAFVAHRAASSARRRLNPETNTTFDWLEAGDRASFRRASV